MFPNNKDEHEFNDLITSNPEKLKDVWKSKQTRFWNKKTILLALVILIGLSLSCIYFYLTFKNKDSAEPENFSDLSELSDENELQSDSSESCKDLPYEYKDDDNQIIHNRLDVRLHEGSEANGIFTYEQHFSTFDDQFISELSQTEPDDPYNYFIALDKITWSVPCANRAPDKRYEMEIEFKKRYGQWLNWLVNSYMKDYHRIIKQGSQFCIQLQLNQNEEQLTFRSIQTDLAMESHQAKYMNQFFANAIYDSKLPPPPWEFPVETQWCYSIYNVELEKLFAQRQIPKSDVYPQIVIKDILLNLSDSDSPENSALYESLINQKIEQLRQDIVACLVDYPNDRIEIRMMFDVSGYGGPISFIEKNSFVFFKTKKSTMDLFRCLKLGDVLPRMMNDIPILTNNSAKLRVIFEVNAPMKEELNKAAKDLGLDIPTDPSKLSGADKARLVKESLVQLNDTLQKACHPALNRVSVKFKLKGNGRSDNIQVDIDLTPKDSQCIHKQIAKYQFPPLGGSDMPVSYTFLFKKE